MCLRIKEIREDKKITQITLARAAGISRVQISRIENGQCKPKLDTLFALATSLGCNITDLLDGHLVESTPLPTASQRDGEK